MMMLTQWRQDGIWNPSDPYQRSRTYYTQIPGGYGTFYETRVPATATLKGPLGMFDSSSILSMVLVGLGGVAAGYVGYKVIKRHRRRR